MSDKNEIVGEVLNMLLSQLQLMLSGNFTGNSPPPRLVIDGVEYVPAENKSGIAVDGITEERMAEAIGLSKPSLEAQRKKGHLPRDEVWSLINGRIIYSISGYNQWLKEQMEINSQKASNIMATASVFGSCGGKSAGAKRSPSRRPKQTSPLQLAPALK